MRGAEWSGASLKVVTRALNAQTAGGGRRRRAPRVRNLSNDLFLQKRLDRFGTRVPMKSPKSDLLGLIASRRRAASCPLCYKGQWSLRRSDQCRIVAEIAWRMSSTISTIASECWEGVLV
jgi:hypothetical protein